MTVVTLVIVSLIVVVLYIRGDEEEPTHNKETVDGSSLEIYVHDKASGEWRSTYSADAKIGDMVIVEMKIVNVGDERDGFELSHSQPPN